MDLSQTWNYVSTHASIMNRQRIKSESDNIKSKFKNERIRSADDYLDGYQTSASPFEVSEEFSKTSTNEVRRQMHLATENKEIREVNKVLQEKLMVVESKLNETYHTNMIQENLLKNWYLPKGTGSTDPMKKTLKTYWFKRYTQQIADLKSQNKNMIYKLKLSYARQVEDLQEMIGNMSQSFSEVCNQKSEHGAKFVEIISKLKEKYQKLKNECKHLKK